MIINFSSSWFQDFIQDEKQAAASNLNFQNSWSGRSTFFDNINVYNSPSVSWTAVGRYIFTLDHVSLSAVKSGDLHVCSYGLTYVCAKNSASLKHQICDKFTKPVRHLDKSIFHSLLPVVIGGSSNYGHFMFEFLPKMLFAASSFSSSACLLIAKDMKKYLPFFEIALKNLKLSMPKIFFLDSAYAYSIDDAVVVQSSHRVEKSYFFDYRLISLLNKSLHVPEILSQQPKRIFAARPAGSIRSIDNQANVDKILRKYGFQKLILGDLDPRLQLSLISNASHLLIHAGADSPIAVASPDSSTVVELLPEKFLLGFGPISLSKILNYEYSRHKGKPSNNYGKLQIDTNFCVDASALDHYLNSIF
jgi:hypothetical protein